MSSRIAPGRLDRWPRHDEALAWMDALILDLKLIQAGEKPSHPVDMTRLEEWRKHRNDIENCVERRKFY